MAARHPALRAREELVPGGELGERAVDDHLELPVVARRRAPIRVAVHESRHFRVEQQPRALRRRLRALERVEARLETLTVRAQDPGPRRPEEGSPLQELARHVHAGVEALAQVGRPRSIRVEPALDRVHVPRVLLQEEPGEPAVVPDRLHRDLPPARVLGRPVEEHRGEGRVALAQDVGRDLEHVADHALDRESPAVELGSHVGDPHRAHRPAGRDAGPRPHHAAPARRSAVAPHAGLRAGSRRATGKSARTAPSRSAVPPSSRVASIVAPVKTSR